MCSYGISLIIDIIQPYAHNYIDAFSDFMMSKF